MIPPRNHTLSVDPCELALVGPALRGEDCKHSLTETMASGFSPAYIRSRGVRFIFLSLMDLYESESFTQEKLLSMANASEEIMPTFAERVTWICEAGAWGMPFQIPQNALQVTEAFLRQQTEEAVSTLPKGSAQSAWDELDSRLASLRSKAKKRNEDEKLMAIQELHEEVESGKSLPKSFVKPWDDCLGGLPNAQVIVLSGRPGGGKTALSEQIIDEQLKRGNGVLYIQRELQRSRAVGRLAARRANVPWFLVEQRSLNPQQRTHFLTALDTYKDQPLFLMPISTCNAASLKATILYHSEMNDVKLVVMDYIQLVDVPKGGERRIAIGEACYALKAACNETGVTVIAIAQLNRMLDRSRDPKPTMSDLRESGDIESSADVIVALWEAESREERTRFEVNWTIPKNRNGPLGTVSVMFDGPSMSFLGKTI